MLVGNIVGLNGKNLDVGVVLVVRLPLQISVANRTNEVLHSNLEFSQKVTSPMANRVWIQAVMIFRLFSSVFPAAHFTCAEDNSFMEVLVNLKRTNQFRKVTILAPKRESETSRSVSRGVT